MSDGVLISVQLDDKSIGQVFDDAATRAEDKRDLFEQIGQSLVRSTEDRFDRETGPDGSPWPKSIRALLVGGKTLQASGALLASISYNATSDQVEVGSSRIYAAVQQFGATIKAKAADFLRFKIGNAWFSKAEVTIPARPFVGVDDPDREEISAIGLDWMAGLFGGASGAAAEVTP